jgi:integrase
MAKRSYGSGNIIERSPGVFLIRYRDNNGKRHNETIKGNRKRAEAVLTQHRVALEGGMFTGKKNLTVGLYLQDWLDTYAVPNCSAKTVQAYRQTINRYTVDISHLQLQKLEATDIQPIYADMSKQKLSNNTIDSLHKVLHIALNTAVKQGVLKRNVMAAVIAPKVVSKQVEVWDPETRSKAIEVLKDSRFGDFYLLALLTGMRKGELAGLKWANVDLERGRLQVVNTLQRISGRGLVLGVPKTERSRRSIALSDASVGLLHEVRGKQTIQKAEIADAWTQSGFVLTHPDGMPLDSEVVSKAFTKLVKEAGFPDLTMHGLRHTHATILLEQGVNPKVVSERLGHASVATTMDIYSHVLPDMQEKAAQVIDTVLSPK